jgi:hypothetical protein
MQVNEVKYARKFNTGNYESEEYSVTATVEDGENANEVFAKLKEEVIAARTGQTTGTTAMSADSAEEVEEQEVVVEEEQVEEQDEEVVEEESEEVEEETAEEEVEEDESEEEEVEEEVPVKAAKGKKAAATGKGKKTFKPKTQTYSRKNETHKEIFSKVLSAVAPDWRKSKEAKDHARKVSEKMDGTDFLDEDGNVFPSFKELVRKAMTPKGKKK